MRSQILLNLNKYKCFIIYKSIQKPLLVLKILLIKSLTSVFRKILLILMVLFKTSMVKVRGCF